MKKKVIAGLVLVCALLLSIVLRELVSPYFFDVFILIASTYATYEVSLAIAKADVANSAQINKVLLYAPPTLSVATFVLFLPLLLTGSITFFLPFEIVLIAAFVFFAYFYAGRMQQNQRRHCLAIIYPNFLFIFFYLVNHINAFNPDLPASLGLFGIVLTFAIAVFTDTAAMYTGMYLKGPKLCPAISPNKRISGAAGGLVMGTVAAICVFAIFNAINEFKEVFANAGTQIWYFIFVGIVLSALNQLGDIYESYLKRKLGIKDMGSIIPGHGGIMDRLDGVCFVVAGIFCTMLLLFV